jgi:hypothetical protein
MYSSVHGLKTTLHVLTPHVDPSVTKASVIT